MENIVRGEAKCYICHKTLIKSCIQWNPSKTDTIREITFVLYKEVSYIQGFIFLIGHLIARREINNTLQLLMQ